MSGEFRGISVAKLSPTVVRSAAAATNGASFDLLTYDGDVRIVLNASATGGAGQTLDVKIQHSADGSTWTDSGVAFAQVTNAAASYQTLSAAAEQFHRYIRVVDTVAGSSPSVAFGVVLLAKSRV